MPFWQLYFHLVWATKEREPLITPQVEHALFPFLVAKASELNVFVYALNGWTDHVHVIGAIPPASSVAQVVKLLKGASSHMLNHSREGNFAWQRGYGALTIGPKQLPFAIEYVQTQKTHHSANSANVWLERTADHDEGPDATPRLTTATMATAAVVKEAGPEYILSGDVDDNPLPLAWWD